MVVASGEDAVEAHRDSGYEGSAEQEGLWPVVQRDGSCGDEEASSQWAAVQEHGYLGLTYQSGQTAYPSEIDEPLYFESEAEAGGSCICHDCANGWSCQ